MNIAKQKDLVALRQGAQCEFCGSTENLCVDHQHLEQMDDSANDGHIRGVLCSACNGRYGLASIEGNMRIIAERANITLSQAFVMVAAYVLQDSSQNALYPTYIADKCKQFKRLQAAEQTAMLVALGNTTVCRNATQRLAAYRALLKLGRL